MIELVPNNKKRIEVTITDRGQPVIGRIVTVRLAMSATSAAPLGTMTYTAEPDPANPSNYVVDLPGMDIATAARGYGFDKPLVIQVHEGTDLAGFVDAVFKPARRL